MSSPLDWHIDVTLADGSVYRVPVAPIARDRAAYYAEREYDGDVEESLRDDTLPFFAEGGPYNIVDWWRNNMNPEDFPEGSFREVKPPPTFEPRSLWDGEDFRVVRSEGSASDGA